MPSIFDFDELISLIYHHWQSVVDYLCYYVLILQINCAIIPREGSSLDEEEVMRHCKKNLASFKVPKKVFITESLPKTATGKIQRRIVAEHFLAQISTAKVPKFGA